MGNKNFCVFRVEKIKSGAGVKAQLDEMLPDEIADENGKTETKKRTSERADEERSAQNTNSGTVTESFEKYRNFLPAKVRKNAVVGLSFLVSTSQEFSDRETEEKYYEDSRKFISEHFGKVVAWSIHRDETSTHMQVITVPLDENNKLNAKKLIGGSSKRLSEIQTNFGREVGKKYGLERGEKGSKAKHKTVEELHKAERAEIEKQKKELSEKQTKIKRQEKEIQNTRDGLDSLKQYYRQEKENQERNLKEREEALIRRESEFNSRYDFFELSKNLWLNAEKGLNDDFENFEKNPSKSGFKKLKENCMNLYKRVKNLFLDVKEKLTKYEDRPLEEVIENFQNAQKKGFRTYGEFLKNQSNSNANPNSNIQKKSKLGRN